MRLRHQPSILKGVKLQARSGLPRNYDNIVANHFVFQFNSEYLSNASLNLISHNGITNLARYDQTQSALDDSLALAITRNAEKLKRARVCEHWQTRETSVAVDSLESQIFGGCHKKIETWIIFL